MPLEPAERRFFFLVDACGADCERMAELSIVFALAAVGLVAADSMDPSPQRDKFNSDRVEGFQGAIEELRRRVRR